MREDVGNAATDTFLKADGGLETRDDALELRAVEDYGGGLVAYQVALQFVCLGGYGSQESRRDILRLVWHTEGIGYGLVDLVPCQRLV